MTEEYRPKGIDDPDVSETMIKGIQEITGGSSYAIAEQLIVDGAFIREQINEGAAVWLKFPDGRETEVQFKPIKPDTSKIIEFPIKPQALTQEGE